MSEITITIDEYLEYREEYVGVCLECGAEREMCEPDADGYQCEDCGEHAVQGCDNLLAMGKVK